MSESVLTVSESLLPVPDSAGHASFRSFDPSHPLCPLQLDACVDWNADTGHNISKPIPTKIQLLHPSMVLWVLCNRDGTLVVYPEHGGASR